MSELRKRLLRICENWDFIYLRIGKESKTLSEVSDYHIALWLIDLLEKKYPTTVIGIPSNIKSIVGDKEIK